MSPGLTPSQTVGPYLHLGLCGCAWIGPLLATPGSPGALRVQGRVLDGAGEPVADALVEVWQAGQDGSYLPSSGRFGRCDTREDGRFAFVTVKPGPVAWPDGGTQAPHLELGVFARGLLKRAVTRMYFPDEAAANDADPLLARVDPDRRATLVARPEPDGTLRFDIRLQGDGETVFFAL